MANAFSHVKDLTVGQLSALVQRVGGLGAVMMILQNDDIAANIRDLVVGAKKMADDIFAVMVDYVTPTFAELTSRFDMVLLGYNKFKFETSEVLNKTVERECCEIMFQLVHLKRTTSMADALAELDKRGLRPAIYEELVAFAEMYPDEQRKHPIVAMGSVCVDFGGSMIVPMLEGSRETRCLDVYRIENRARADFRFLATPK